nr:hypothetical protein [uncultured Pseudomonas sp.]
MTEALFHFLVEVLLYGKGYWALRLLSLGLIDPRRWNDVLVSLVGFMVTLAWFVPLLLWMTGSL